MSASRTAEPVVWRGALIGAALFFSLSLLVCFWVLERPPALIWLASAFALAGALVGHLGMRNSGHVVGASCGLALGLLAGAVIGDEIGGYIPVDEPGMASSTTAEGQPMQIAGPTLDGALFDIKEWQGKFVLVDFWATWCPPCVAEIPNVKKAYDRFHKDGFEVIGVSLDERRESLAQFVKKHEMPWPQIIFEDPSQLKWDSPLARKFEIRAIPAMFLLDGEGRIISAVPSGEKLMPMLEQAINGVRIGLFPMGLFLGACLGGYAGIQIGEFMARLLRRKRNPLANA